MTRTACGSNVHATVLVAILSTGLAGCGGSAPPASHLLSSATASMPSASASSAQVGAAGQVSSASASSGSGQTEGSASASSDPMLNMRPSQPSISITSPTYNIDPVSADFAVHDSMTAYHEPPTIQHAAAIGTPTYHVGKAFVARLTGVLTRIELVLQSCSVIPTPLHVDIRRGSSFDAPVIATGMVAAGLLPTSDGKPCAVPEATVYRANVLLSRPSAEVIAGETLSVWPSSREADSYAWAGNALNSSTAISATDSGGSSSAASAGSVMSPEGNTTSWSTATPAADKQASIGFAPGFRLFVLPAAD